MSTETIHAGGGIYIDVVQPKKPVRKPRKKSTKNKDDVILAELTPEQAKALNEALTAKVPEVDVEVVEPDVLPCPASTVIVEEQLADGTVVSEGPSTLPTVSMTRSINPHHPISMLPPGSDFMSNGIVGRFIEMVGMDAKVELDNGSIQYWSNASMVYWLPCKPRSTARSTKKSNSEAIPAVEKTETITAASVATKREPKTQVKRNSAFGHAGVAIARWLGKHDYSLSDAVAALARVGITHLSEGTIKVNLCGGKAGRYGGAPELTQDQINQLLGK